MPYTRSRAVTPDAHRLAVLLLSATLFLFVPFVVLAAAGSADADMVLLPARATDVKLQTIPTLPKQGQKNRVKSANPWLSFLPVEVEPDYEGWQQVLGEEAKQRAAQRAQISRFANKMLFSQAEVEAANEKGVNDTIFTAEALTAFGTAAGKDPAANVTGTLRALPAPVVSTVNAEDDGSIIAPTVTGLVTDQSRIFSSTIGDGPYGTAAISSSNTDLDVENDSSIALANATSMLPYDLIVENATIGDGPGGSTGTASGDWDFYAITVDGRQLVTMIINATDGTFRPILAVYDNVGTLLGSFDDLATVGEVLLFAEFTTVGGPADFYIGIGGNRELDGNLSNELLLNPNDDTSGQGVGSEGTYSLAIEYTPPGDFDFYSFDAVAGDFFTFEVDTDAYGGVLDPIIAIFDAAGTAIDSNDDGSGAGTQPYDSFLSWTAPATATYYAAVGGYLATPVAPDTFVGVNFPTNRSDSASGQGYGAEGDYDLTITRNVVDVDAFSFELQAGDIIGMNLTGAAPNGFIANSFGDVLIASASDGSALFPANSPLPGGGNASMAYVVNDPGTYYALTFGGEGAYTMELRGFRPPQEASNTTQTIFLDFDGATIDASIFDPGGNPSATLSPLAAFLADWGLQPGDEDAVIDAVVANVKRSLQADINAAGLNSKFDIRILNSRDHADPFATGGGGAFVPTNDLSNTSRVIIGGTVAESGVNTIGIAESIDVGNYGMSESALVLLDLLSDPSETNPNSLNQFVVDPGSSMIELVGTAVGNIAAHEAGHFLANYHTDNASLSANIMDTGGNLPNLVGVGPDLIFGTGDDVNVLFGEDVYDVFEGFSGFEDTRNAIGWALPSGLADLACSSGAPPVVCSVGDINNDGTTDIAVVLPGATVTAQIRDGLSGAILSTLDFGPDAGVAVEVLDDINGNSAPEIAVLGNRPSGQVRVLVVDSVTGSLINSIFYGSVYTAVDMAVLPDTDTNNAAELAVLGLSAANAVRVQARDSLTDATTSTSFYGNNTTPVDVQVLPDMSGNGVPEIVVHARVTASGQGRAQIKDASTGVMVRQLFFGSTYNPIHIAVVGDVTGDGLPDIAQLSRRDDTGAVRVQVKGTDGGPAVSNAFLGNTEVPVEVTGIWDANGDSFPDIAVLVERTNGQGKVIVRDARTGDFIRNVFVGKAMTPDGLVIVDDVNASGDPELAALGDSADNPGTPLVQVKDSIDGAAISTVEYP